MLDWNEPAKAVYRKMGAVHVSPIGSVSAFPSGLSRLSRVIYLAGSSLTIPYSSQKKEWEGMRLEGEALAKLAE